VHDPPAGPPVTLPVVRQVVPPEHDRQLGGAAGVAVAVAAHDDERLVLGLLPVPHAADAAGRRGADDAAHAAGVPAHDARGHEEEGLVAPGVAVAPQQLPRRAAAGVGVDDRVLVRVREADGAREEVLRHDVLVRRVELVRRRHGRAEAEPPRLHCSSSRASP